MKVKPFSADPSVGGWYRGVGDNVFHHSMLGRILHVAICKDDGSPMWDQPLHIEPIGAVTVPVNRQGQIGMVVVERPTVREAGLYQFPELDLETLGVASLELPRGLPRKGEASAQTAAREGEEELDSPILGVTQIGEITPNTTFHPHRIPVFQVKVNEAFKGTLPPDVNEKILKVDWVTEKALNGRIARGEIHCAMTLAALQLYFADRNKLFIV